MPSSSYTVGTMSTAWMYCWRTSFDGLICFGQAIMHMSATPPSYPAHRFQYGNGVSNAHAHPTAMCGKVRSEPHEL